MNTEITIAGVTFKNPVMTASGTFGSGMEYSDAGFVGFELPRRRRDKRGCRMCRGREPHSARAGDVWGMLNAIGLQNPGIDVLIEGDFLFETV